MHVCCDHSHIRSRHPEFSILFIHPILTIFQIVYCELTLQVVKDLRSRPTGFLHFVFSEIYVAFITIKL